MNDDARSPKPDEGERVSNSLVVYFGSASRRQVETQKKVVAALVQGKKIEAVLNCRLEFFQHSC
jgi:hypothetical protein